jgi:tetratricopeptide (TPR) repeat protein
MREGRLSLIFLSFLFCSTACIAQSVAKEGTSFDRGLQAAKKQDWSTAISAFTEAQKASPRDPKVLFNLGLAYANDRDYLPAIGWWHAYLEIAPDDTSADTVRAEIRAIKTQLRSQEQKAFAKAEQLAKSLDDSKAQGYSKAVDALIPVISREIISGEFDLAKETLSYLRVGEITESDLSKPILLNGTTWVTLTRRDLEAAIVLQRAHVAALQGDFDSAKVLLKQLGAEDLAFAQYGYYTDANGRYTVGDRYYDTTTNQWLADSGSVQRHVPNVGRGVHALIDDQLSIFLARLSYELLLVPPHEACFDAYPELGKEAREQSWALQGFAQVAWPTPPWPSSNPTDNIATWDLPAFMDGPYKLAIESSLAKCCGHEGASPAQEKCRGKTSDVERWIDFAQHICDEDSYSGGACSTSENAKLLAAESAREDPKYVPDILAALGWNIGVALLRCEILEKRIAKSRVPARTP